MEGATADAAGLVRAGLAVLTVTSAAAAYRSAARDVGSVAFVATSYGALLLLFRCLRAYELVPPGAVARKANLRRRIWCLCTLLTALFAWKVAGVMPWPFAMGIWAVAADASIGGFFALFCRRP